MSFLWLTQTATILPGGPNMSTQQPFQLDARFRRAVGWLRRCCLVVVVILAGPVAGQTDENPVYIDDSPRAWELFQRASDQRKENVGEAARLYQELLDTYAFKLIPAGVTEEDRFASTRQRVHETLLADEELLDRYRSMAEAPAESLLAQGQIGELLRSHYLTPAALEALLLRAQDELERGKFDSVIQLLRTADDHPDLAGRTAAYRWLMLGLAAHQVDDTELRGSAVTALADWPTPLGQTLHKELMKIFEAGPGPRALQGMSIFQPGPPADVNAMVDEPIWAIELPHTITSRRYNSGNSPPNPNQLDSERNAGTDMAVAPAVAGGAVYVNQGQVIGALDRFSQREIWSTKIGNPSTSGEQRNSRLGDMNAITVEGDRLITLTGYAGGRGRVGTGLLVCLDRNSGESLWEVEFDELGNDDELRDLFPYAVPMIADGQVLVSARKVNRQSLASHYIVAIDLYTGQPNWVRYIASCGGLQNTITRPFGTLAVDGGDIFVASSLGAVARLSMLTGEIIWLQRTDLELRTTQNRPWEMPGPVVTPSSVVAISPDESRVLVFDRTGGQVIADYPATNWGSPRYLLANDDWIYAVSGDELAGVYQQELATPVWMLSEMTEIRSFDEIRGRVSIAGRTVVVPVSDAVYMVDGESGEVLREIAVDGASVPLVDGAELFVAQTDRLSAYIPIQVAENRLREQLQRNPGQLDPALSLLRLASDKPDSEEGIALALEASGLALQAIEQLSRGNVRDEASAEVFGLIVDVAANAQLASYESGSKLFRRLAEVATTPMQKVGQRLAEGDWYAALARETDRAYLTDAIESYQSVLGNEELATTQLLTNHVVQPARMAAMNRLTDVMQEFGSELYQPMADSMQNRLAALGSEPSVDDVLAIAREFPFATASREAVLDAAAQLEATGHPRDALAALVSMYTTATDLDEQAIALSRIVQLADAEGWHDLAAYWLKRSAQQHSIIQLTTTDDELRDVADWLQSLEQTHIDHRLAELGTRFDADRDDVMKTTEGKLISLYDSTTPRPPDWALLFQGNQIARIDAEKAASETWRIDVAGTRMLSPSILQYGSDRMVLWLDNEQEAIALAPESGNVVWRSGALRQRLADLRPDNSPLGSVRGNLILPGMNVRVDPTSVLPLVLGENVFVIGRGGGVIRFKPADQTNDAVWEVDHPISGIHYAAIHDLGLVLTGQVRNPNGREFRGWIAVLDSDTGKVLYKSLTADERPASWLTITPRGTAIYGSDSTVESIDLASLERQWVNTDPDAEFLTRSWNVQDNVMLADNTTRLRMLDTTTGELTTEFQPHEDRGSNIVTLRSLQQVGGRILAHYGQRVVWFDQSGTVEGQDVLPSRRNYTDVVPFAGGVIASNNTQGQGSRTRRRGIDTLYMLSESAKLLDHRAVPTDHNEPTGVVALDGWVLISHQSQTIWVPTAK